MRNLTTALMTYFNKTEGGVHNSFWISITGKLRKEKAEQTDTLPYAVYHIISDVPSWTFSSDFEDVRIQFDLYSQLESSSQIEDMYTNLKALFDWCSLTVTGSTHLYMRRESARLTKDPEDSVWHYSVDYTTKLELN
jgi:hypothetical protein